MTSTADPSPPGGERLLVDEQAALRRVATLVAGGAQADDVFAAVAVEAAHLLAIQSVMLARYEPDRAITVLASSNDPRFAAGSRWPLDGPSVPASVLDTGRPARIDDYSTLAGSIAEAVRASDNRAAVGVPVAVDGAVCGVMTLAAPESALLPQGVEERLADFTELVAIAISNAESGVRLRRLANEQAALRRIATLVAEAAPEAQLFSAFAHEAAHVLDLSNVAVVRYDADGSSTVVASLDGAHFPVGSRWPSDGPSLNATVLATRKPARMNYAELPGEVAAAARASGAPTGVGVPIVVNGSVWGMVAAGSTDSREPPPDAETRLTAFTELVAIALAKGESRERFRLLAEEQAALRRVATVVAEGAPREDVFAAVAEEVSRVLDIPSTEITRYGPDGTATMIASYGGPHRTGTTWALDGPSVVEMVYRTGRPARLDSYEGLRSAIVEDARRDGARGAVGAPIVVDGSVWGAIVGISRSPEPIPAGHETRLGLFTELVAIAISNLQAHDDLRGLVDEQAALRRVATLVAEGAGAEELFSAVAAEVAQLLDVSGATVERYEADGTQVTLATSRDPDWAAADTAACAAPIVVEGKQWGLIGVFSRQGASLPADTEARLAGFTELVATAVSNAAARTDLIASRARIVAAGDEARQRIERNLHDGTQQRLIALGLDLRRIRASLPDDGSGAGTGIERMEEVLASVLDDVRELSRGLRPPMLSRRGLAPSLRALARRSPLPVDVDVELHERPPAAAEAALYYIVSEALANAAKHSKASGVTVRIETDHMGVPSRIGLDGRRGAVTLHASIADDGVGGADPASGTGLMGIVDRVDALGGRCMLESPPGQGTRISITLPVEAG